VKKDEFAHATLDLWMTTAIPLTLANVQYHTGAPRRRARKWLEQMLRDGELELDSDDDGEMLFLVPGAKRPADGARSFAERDRFHALRADVAAQVERKRAARARLEAQRAAKLAQEQARKAREQALVVVDSELEASDKPSLWNRLRGRYDAGTALSVASSARRELDKGPRSGNKSLLASGALSFFLGPLGWLYAGSFRESIPAALAFLLAMKILPLIILWPLVGVAFPVSGLIGVVYAWQYNHSGKRQRLLGDGDDDK
jgi:hypothetical protein